MNDMTRYMMPARSQGKLYAQRAAAAYLERDTHRWVFVRNLTPEVDARGLNALGTVKALIKATGLNPHLSVYGWPFCLDDVDAAEGGAA